MTRSPLRTALDECGVPLKDVTVLAPQNDPFRQDTDANHRDGAWLAEQVQRLGLMGHDRTIHLRGLHYALIDSTRPNGKQYINEDSIWTWMSGGAAKAARWLGYIPWEKIKDQRNAEPTVTIHVPPEPQGWVSVGGLYIEIPGAQALVPRVATKDFVGTQPYKIVLFGEKSSLEPVLAPLARRWGADLYLPTGEISDTLMHTMASVGARDGRPMVVLTFSDSDPAGWQMPISIGRKLQAFKTTLFPDLEFQVRRVGLLPEHVKKYGLPSTPLKDTEKRADRWREAMGVQQTEIDALAALQPKLLEDIATDAILDFYDLGLSSRVLAAKREWEAEAQRRLDEELSPEMRAEFRQAAVERLAELQEQVDALEAEMQIDPGEIDLPDIELPLAIELRPPDDAPLVDSRWSFVEQCQALIESKGYRR